MAFTNLQVALSELPAFEDIDYSELDPAYARLVLRVVLAVECVLLVAASLVWLLVDIPQAQRDVLELLWIPALALLGLYCLYRYKAARVIQYAIREHDVVLRLGIFFQRETIQPIRRIQHVELARGPLEKRAGLASVRLYSAGSGKATFTIPGLKLLTAARIRRYVLQAASR